MEIEIITGLPATLLIILIIAGLKKVGMNTKLAPVFAIILGVGLSFGFHIWGQTDWWGTLFLGVVIGLSAVGLFSGVKNTKEFIQHKY